MQYTLALVAGLAATVAAVPQGVSSAVAPASSAPAGCMSSYPGTFEIETVNVSSSAKRDLQSRQANVLTLTLSNGVLTDSKGRTGYIAAKNNQFQFDNPPQAGAIYTSGFSVCQNGTLALGGSAIFQQCLASGYYDLYFQYNAPQCSNIYIDVIPLSGSGGGAASQLSDGQPQATPAPICQISDGQPQKTSCVPVTQLTDGQPQATSAVAPVTQLSDGQPQATSAKAPVTQLTDGQPQAPTSTAKPTPVSQLSDGQPQASAGKSASSTRSAVATYTGAATNVRGDFFGLAAGVLAVALL